MNDGLDGRAYLVGVSPDARAVLVTRLADDGSDKIEAYAVLPATVDWNGREPYAVGAEEIFGSAFHLRGDSRLRVERQRRRRARRTDLVSV